MRISYKAVALWGAVATLSVLGSLHADQAHAQTIPFFVTGTGEVLDPIPSAPGLGIARHNISAGFATKGGGYVGERGRIEILAPPDGSLPLSVKFQSDEAFLFEFRRGGLFGGGPDVLACDYGVTGDFGQNPAIAADETGTATLISIDDNGTPENPLDDVFKPFFLAEFIPTLDGECTGRFAPSRLKGGSFMMLAIGEPVVLNGSGSLVAADGGPTFSYNWYGLGTLKFKFPFGLLP